MPVDIDTGHPDGSTGATEAILALRFDPQVFDVSAADVQLGSLTGGWQMTAVVNAQTGEIGIDLWSTSAIQTTAGGSMVLISMHVRDTAPTGASGLDLVTAVNPTGQRPFKSYVADAQGAFVLHPAETNNGIEPGSPAMITVGSRPEKEEDQVFGQVPRPADRLGTTTAADLDPLTAPSAHAVELVFGGLAGTSSMVQEAAWGQPAPILDADDGDAVAAGLQGLSSPLPTNGVTQMDWTSDDCLAYLFSDENRFWRGLLPLQEQLL